jgi:ABC-type polysaccharide/polyol phosphate transport system ATPase subunit
VTHGRVGALIELTGGFNMDLTLEENIVMHYVMNGFSKKIAKSRVNEIVEWAGLEDYLYEPLHSLSSGMVARFAFSTQTSITPEILILDEILSVGDAEFQAKSRLKILDLIHQGSIVIIVSHSVQDLQALTKRTIWLENGSVKLDGLTETVCAEYLSSFNN